MKIYYFISLLFFSFVFLFFIMKIGKQLPFIELVLLIAGLQWVVSPFIEYQYPTNHFLMELRWV
jgi:hypothetical protein